MLSVAGLLFLIVTIQGSVLPDTTWSSLKPRHIADRQIPFSKLQTPHIVGGTIAQAGEIPFQVGMFMDNTYFCGGSLIGPDVVLTAAHCVQAVRSFAVYLGSLRVSDPVEDGRVVITTSLSVAHESYNPGMILNDIGLVYLGTTVTYNARIQPIRLAPISAGTYADEIAVVSGWGQESDASPSISEDLRYTNVRVMTMVACRAIWGSSVPDTQLCVDTNGGLNTPCFGDSGGPLTVPEADGIRTQIGIVSYVSGAGCESGIPSVFSRVSSYVDWVAANGGPAVRP